jgi:hypothetical protein
METKNNTCLPTTNELLTQLRRQPTIFEIPGVDPEGYYQPLATTSPDELSEEVDKEPVDAFLIEAGKSLECPECFQPFDTKNSQCPACPDYKPGAM